MKKKHLLLISVLIIGASLIWWAGRRKSRSEPQLFETAPVQQREPTPSQTIRERAEPPIVFQQPTVQRGQPVSDADMGAYGRKTIAEQEARSAEIQKQWKSQWDTPVSFYGKVVDESEASVAGASIGFEWTDVLGEGIQSSTTSDQMGLFSLIGVRSRGLTVHASKEGYYTSKSNQTYFLYADITGRGTFTPDASNPVVFHLRKKKEGQPLVATVYPGFARFEKLKPDGTPVELDLLNGVQVPAGNGHLKLEFWKDFSGRNARNFDWTLKLIAPNGGLVETSEEFNFEAPMNSYQPSFLINMPATNQNWHSNVKSKFYIQLSSGKYGRIEISLLADNGIFTVNSAINPSGSRNLEPQ